MRRVASLTAWILYLTVCLSLLIVSPAAAYIDPGSGSLIFQVLVGAALAIPVALATFWRRITGFFSRRDR